MSQKPESRYRLRVEKKLHPSVYHLKLNLQYAAGVADSYYSACDGDLWVEYKWLAKLPVRKKLDLVGGNDPIISKLQQDWLCARHAEGRNVGVVVGTPGGGLVFPGTSWTHVPDVLEFHDATSVAGWIMGETGP